MRFGIIGTNTISTWFVEACSSTDGRAQPVAVLSRDLDRARAFADQYGIEHAVDDLDALIELVDAVYIASPIYAHHDQAMRAIQAGRHVLVEKTMGASAAEVRALLETARARGVVAMEAMRSVHTPYHRVIRDALPRLGALRHAHIEKLQYSSRYDAFRNGEILNAFNPALGNSALADIGVYCLEPALDWFGRPRGVSGASVWLHNGVEAGGSMTLAYDGFVATLTWSKIATGVAPSTIAGEDGALSFDDPSEPSYIRWHPRGGEPETLWECPRGPLAGTMHHEVLDFVDQTDAGALDERWATLTLTARSLMDAHLAR
ncbi:MAG: Gfo/Idh/MocA family oxidoreductase [Propioniciclava sp.]|uniref:Gfo/Idh/MocA family protein n=1 Tax=Propioniciclava sp. TaxID=2038686 RepID=UPI0039E3FACF